MRERLPRPGRRPPGSPGKPGSPGRCRPAARPPRRGAARPGAAPAGAAPARGDPALPRVTPGRTTRPRRPAGYASLRADRSDHVEGDSPYGLLSAFETAPHIGSFLVGALMRDSRIRGALSRNRCLGSSNRSPCFAGRRSGPPRAGELMPTPVIGDRPTRPAGHTRRAVMRGQWKAVAESGWPSRGDARGRPGRCPGVPMGTLEGLNGACS